MSAVAARRAGGGSSPCTGRVGRNGTPAKPMTGKRGSLLPGIGGSKERWAVEAICASMVSPLPRDGRAKQLECGRVRRCVGAVRAQPGEEGFLPAVEVFSLFQSPAGG